MRPILRATVSRTRVRATLMSGGKSLWSGEAAHEGPADLAEVLTHLAADLPAGHRARQLAVEFESPLSQLRTLHDLPPVSSRELANLVSTQATRFFRRNGAPLVTDAVWIGRKRGKQSTARAGAIEEPWLDAIGSAARGLGLRLGTVGVAGDDTKGGRLNLLPPAERVARHRAALLSLRRLAGLIGIVWAGLLAIVVIRLHLELREIESELDRLRQPAAAVASARREVAEAVAMLEAIRHAELQRRRPLERLLRLAQALPDSSYLTSFTADRSGGGTITGAARESARVVAAIERRNAAAAPQLAGPAVREIIAGREWERFTVRFGGSE
jgi:hypothetical protein